MNKTASIEQKGAIIGISMLNPYFTRENIQHTAAAIRERFGRLFFMLPDKPAHHTLYGYGYAAEEAQKTVRRKFNTLERNCRECIAALSLDNANIVRWDEVEPNERYQQALLALEKLRTEDAVFREDIHTSTRAMYENSQYPKKRPIDLEEQIERGTPFLMQEVAFMVSSASIVGVERAVHIYHRDIPVLSSLLKGKYQMTPPADLDFEIVTSEE